MCNEYLFIRQEFLHIAPHLAQYSVHPVQERDHLDYSGKMNYYMMIIMNISYKITIFYF